MRYNLLSDGKNRFRIKKHGQMLVDVVLYLNNELKRELEEDESLDQLAAATSLQGVIEPVIGLPDIHVGFGLPIGGVMAMDSKKGLISAGAVGYDINCGVRLIKTGIPLSKFQGKNKKIDKPKLRKLIRKIEKRVPLGTGKSGVRGKLPKISLADVVEKGVPLLVEKGYGKPSDIECCEEKGSMAGASLKTVSSRAQRRGEDQLSTLGGGNHFIDIQVIEKIYNEEVASTFGLSQNNICVMIHCGSRGFGHQIGHDYMQTLFEEAQKQGLYIPTRGLASVPIESEAGQNYFKAMAAAVNYAFCNRHLIMHDVRDAFSEMFGKSPEALGMELLYDVAHNIAKFEKDASGREYLIHRKGATRALPANHPQNPKIYQETGHPALVPGSMATPSYVLVAGENAQETFYSVNHGAGRRLSRTQAKREVKPQEFEKKLGNILTNFRSVLEVLDEAPMAYKDIELVVDTLTEPKITKKIARLQPIAVMIGQN